MKTCPVCHARAFDDAQMCFGCLHRFDEPSQPVATARPVGRPQPAPCPFSGGKPDGPAVRTAPRVRGDASSAAPRLEGPPLDGLGWVVRFEFPGCASVEEVQGGAAHVVRIGGTGQEELHPKSLVVSLRPDESASGRQDQPAAMVRGSHVRAAVAAAAERS